jgi:hypothetical protein
VVRWEAENTVALAPTHEDIEGLVQKVTLLKGELSEACQAREVAEGKFHSLSDTMAYSSQWLVVSERECRE